ncbi:MAG TPA: hypothetical protein VHS31_10095 [Tepidisphaeraceae bacterium]|jgi:hypothetical protein|nr:hypothetical protein [Tepidisphaeraceae bacterium]
MRYWFTTTNLIFAGIVLIRSVAVFAAPATTQSSDGIVEVLLQDPTSAQAKSFLDLDTGKTYTYGESTPEDFLQSRRWITQVGADLMCESRAPAEGFVAYDMVLVDSTAGINQPIDFAALRKEVGAKESEPFQLISAGSSASRTYHFRTQDGAMGVLEIAEIVKDDPPGIRLRYRVVHQAIAAGPRHLSSEELRVQLQQQQLTQLQQKYLQNHPLVIEAERKLKLYQKMAEVESKEPNPQLRAVVMAKVSEEYVLEVMRESLGDNNPQVIRLQWNLFQVEGQIAKMKKARPATNQATTEGTTAPAENVSQ